MLRVCLQVFALTLAGVSTAAGSPQQAKTGLAGGPTSVEKIGPDLYAYISENDSSSNSTFLVGDKDILVVDSGLNAEEGRKLLYAIRKVSPLPVRWIVNTHYHPDHRGGNSVVGPDAVVISTPYTRQQVLAALKKQEAAIPPLPPAYLANNSYTREQLIEAFTKQLEAANRRQTEYAVNETIQHEVTLYVGSHEVRIYHPGPAHTRGDLIVYFPDQHAVATGDLFLTNSCPYMDDGDLDNWIVALNDVLDLPVEHVIPGHFGVATKKEVAFFRDYLAELRVQVARLYRRNLSLEQTKAALKLDKFKSLRQFPKYEATFADNAAAYYHQLEFRRNHNGGAPRAQALPDRSGIATESPGIASESENQGLPRRHAS